MELWKDGRSGAKGCLAGNLVLADLVHKGEKLASRKGTTFTGKNTIYVGRVCSNEDYLSKGQRHWANISPSQHHAVFSEAEGQGKKLFYLFITASNEPATVHYWKVPGKLVGELLGSLPVKPSDDSSWVRIRQQDSRQLLEGGKQSDGLEVSQYYHEIQLETEQAAALQRAFQNPAAVKSEVEDISAEQLLRLNSFVKDMGGIPTVRRALDILDNLKL